MLTFVVFNNAATKFLYQQMSKLQAKLTNQKL